MANFREMAKDLEGDIPGLPLPKAQTFLQESLLEIYDTQRWSFQIKEGGWITPGLLGGLQNQLPYKSPGSITVAAYDTTVFADAVATTAWGSLVGRPFITEQQIRVPAYSLYNIIAYFVPGADPLNPTSLVATLRIDRPWMEPTQTNAVYMIYQAYFPTGVFHFRKFGNIRDTTNNQPINFWQRDQTWLGVNDAQRTVFDQPTYAIPYKTDQRLGSATLGQMMYELWPHPLSQLPYTYILLHKGPPLILPTDEVPYPLNSETLLWLARDKAYLWKESQKGDGLQRGSGADWRFLSQDAFKKYKLRLKECSLLDVGLGDLYWSKFNQTMVWNDGYETTIGTLNVGNWS